jgi:hypothetical protein
MSQLAKLRILLLESHSTAPSLVGYNKVNNFAMQMTTHEAAQRLAKEQLMDHQYIPVGPLMPLRVLVGPGAQQ